MDYTLTHYKQNRGIIFRTSGGNKYLISKRKSYQVYLKCVLFRSGCKSTAKLSQDKNLIYVFSDHNHGVELYNEDVYSVKNKCKEAAKSFMMLQGTILKEEQLHL